jgi:hypothetical protein
MQHVHRKLQLLQQPTPKAGALRLNKRCQFQILLLRFGGSGVCPFSLFFSSLYELRELFFAIHVWSTPIKGLEIVTQFITCAF